MENVVEKYKSLFKKSLSRSKVDYIFCLPGHPSSGMQAIYTEHARMVLSAKGISIGIIPAYSCNIYVVRNGCLGARGHRKDQKPFQGQYEYNRIIWNDSDNHISAEDIEKLVSRDVDIIGAWSRQYSIGDINDGNISNCGKWDLQPRIPGIYPGHNKSRAYTVGEMVEFSKSDVPIEVDYVGFALLVVKAGVFESLNYPWFIGWEYEWEEDGIIMSDFMTEDAGVCIRLREKGYKIYVDPTVCVKHEKKVLL